MVARDITPVLPDMGIEGERQIFLSARANVLLVADLLERPGRPGPPPPAPEATLAYVRMIVRRSFDVDLMARGYRTGHAALWRACQREACARLDDPELLAEVLEQASEMVFRFINAAIQRVADEFEVERHAYLRWPVARKMEAVVEVLRTGQDSDTEGLSAVLDYDLAGRHVGVVVHVSDPHQDPPEVVAARIVRQLIPNERPLLLPTGGVTAWLWLTSAHDRVALEALVADGGATLGIGEMASGPAGFRETHAQARDALNAALALGRTVARYEDVALHSVLIADPERGRRMVRLVLGELDEDSESSERGRETLRVLLDSGLNRRETARRLGVHVHTVTHRMRRIEELLGRPVDARAAELHAALLLRDMLGP